MKIRLVKGSDYYLISPLINDWWGGRQISGKLPKLFFDHFSSTSFIAEKENEMIGFLIGSSRKPIQRKPIFTLRAFILNTENIMSESNYTTNFFMQRNKMAEALSDA